MPGYMPNHPGMPFNMQSYLSYVLGQMPQIAGSSLAGNPAPMSNMPSQPTQQPQQPEQLQTQFGPNMANMPSFQPPDMSALSMPGESPNFGGMMQEESPQFQQYQDVYTSQLKKMQTNIQDYLNGLSPRVRGFVNNPPNVEQASYLSNTLRALGR